MEVIKSATYIARGLLPIKLKLKFFYQMLL